MKKTLTIILLSTASFCLMSSAFAAEGSKEVYENAKNQANATYKADRAKCDSMSGHDKDVCKEEAKAARTRAKAEAEATYKNTNKARTDAAIDIADADYDVAKEKCKSKSGNDKDVCMKEAKAAHVTAVNEAKANKKSAKAQNDAIHKEQDAEYKVAIEKCDALAGNSKDACVANAKAKFGK